jgi:hypothetical protein
VLALRELHRFADEHRAISLAGRGQDFVRALIATALADAPSAALAYAQQRWGERSGASQIVKTALDALGTNTTDAISDQAAASEFFSVVAQSSIIGKLSGLRRVPLRVRTLTALGATASWVGEGQAKPMTSLSFSAGSLDPKRVVGLTVCTNELLRDGSLAAESTIRADLIRAVTEALDEAFVASATLPDAPTSITASAPAIPATADPNEDLVDLVGVFDGDLSASYLITDPTTAISLSGADRPRAGARGGDIAGIPLITSRSCPAGSIILVDPAGIAVGEGPAVGRVSRQASILMDTAPGMASVQAGSPSGPVSAQLVSMFQSNSVALLVERAIAWQVVRSDAVALITGAAYGQGSP